MAINTYEDALVRGPIALENTTLLNGSSHTHRRISWAAVFSADSKTSFAAFGDLLLGGLVSRRLVT
jgi:hypothetical protein